MFCRKLTKGNAITIPRQIRVDFGICGGTALDITPVDSGLLITKHAPTCRFCGSQEDVLAYNEMEICRSCSDDIMRRFKRETAAFDGMSERR